MEKKNTFFPVREEPTPEILGVTGSCWIVIGPLALLLAAVKSSLWDEDDQRTKESQLISYAAEFLVVLTLCYIAYRIARVWYMRKHKLTTMPVPEVQVVNVCPDEYVAPTEVKATVACQTDTRNYAQEVDRLKKRHNKELRSSNREVRMMRRRYSEKVSKARSLEKEMDSRLSSLQLKVPQLSKEKASLDDEREAIEKQLGEERLRHQELRSKFNKLHTQMAHSLVTDTYSNGSRGYYNNYH